VGAIAAIVCIERPAEAQNGAWCLYINGDGEGEPHCRYATFEQCLADRVGSNSCAPSPYPSAPGLSPLTSTRGGAILKQEPASMDLRTSSRNLARFPAIRLIVGDASLPNGRRC